MPLTSALDSEEGHREARVRGGGKEGRKAKEGCEEKKQKAAKEECEDKKEEDGQAQT